MPGKRGLSWSEGLLIAIILIMIGVIGASILSLVTKIMNNISNLYGDEDPSQEFDEDVYELIKRARIYLMVACSGMFLGALLIGVFSIVKVFSSIAYFIGGACLITAIVFFFLAENDLRKVYKQTGEAVESGVIPKSRLNMNTAQALYVTSKLSGIIVLILGIFSIVIVLIFIIRYFTSKTKKIEVTKNIV